MDHVDDVKVELQSKLTPGKFMLPIDTILNDRIGVKWLQLFMRTEHSEENLMFWLSCEQYRKIRDNGLRSFEAQKIFERFVAENSEFQITFDYELTAEIEAQLQEGDKDPFMFDTLQNTVHKSLEEDIHIRFAGSQEYKNMWYNFCDALNKTLHLSKEQTPVFTPRFHIIISNPLSLEALRAYMASQGEEHLLMCYLALKTFRSRIFSEQERQKEFHYLQAKYFNPESDSFVNIASLPMTESEAELSVSLVGPSTYGYSYDATSVNRTFSASVSKPQNYHSAARFDHPSVIPDTLSTPHPREEEEEEELSEKKEQFTELKSISSAEHTPETRNLDDEWLTLSRYLQFTVMTNFIASDVFASLKATIIDYARFAEESLKREISKQHHSTSVPVESKLYSEVLTKEKQAVALQMTIDSLMEDWELTYGYRLFSRQEHSEENILFLVAVREYEVKSEDEKRRETLQIYERFVSPQAPMQLALSGEIVQRVYQNVMQGETENIWNEAVESVRQLISSDSLKRFVTSDFFQRIMIQRQIDEEEHKKRKSSILYRCCGLKWCLPSRFASKSIEMQQM